VRTIASAGGVIGLRVTGIVIGRGGDAERTLDAGVRFAFARLTSPSA
jgi:hypothetical protein